MLGECKTFNAQLLFVMATTLGVVTSAGCGRSDLEIVGDDDADAVARVLGRSASSVEAGDGTAMLGAVRIASGQMPAAMTRTPSGAYQEIGPQAQYVYRVACTDQAGAELPECASGAAHAEVDLEVRADEAWPAMGARVERNLQWSVADLAAGRATVGGAGTTHVVYDDADGHHYELDIELDYAEVSVAHAPVPQVLRGSVHYDVWALVEPSDGDTRAVELPARLGLRADGSASLTLEGWREYRVDLQTGDVTRRYPL